MAELHILDEPLPRVFLLDCPYFPDERGDFVKFYHTKALVSNGISFQPAESFLTRSKKNVLRGMHFQVDESAHEKLVTCIKGDVLDVVVDVNPDSPRFNKPFAIELSASSNKALLIGKGYAHGFLSLSEDNWMLYSTSTVHNSLLDRGVRWDSIAFDWPISQPLISARDIRHPNINDLA